MQWHQVRWSLAWPLIHIGKADIGDRLGVYVLWDVDRTGIRVLDVGQGIIEKRLVDHLYDNSAWEEENYMGRNPGPRHKAGD